MMYYKSGLFYFYNAYGSVPVSDDDYKKIMEKMLQGEILFTDSHGRPMTRIRKEKELLKNKTRRFKMKGKKNGDN